MTKVIKYARFGWHKLYFTWQKWKNEKKVDKSDIFPNWNDLPLLAGPEQHQVGFFLPSMNTTKVSIFSAAIFVNTTQNSNNNQWNLAQKNKKIWAVYHEIRHWWYFGLIWFFICYWIRLRFNVKSTTIIFFSWTTFSLPRCLGKRKMSPITLIVMLSFWKI